MELLDAFKNDFSPKRKLALSRSVLLGSEAYSRFFNDNKDFFSYLEYGPLRGHLLNYSIQRSLYNAAFSPDAMFQAIPENANIYKQSVLHIKTDNFIITTAKTRKWANLPPRANYKSEYAKANEGGDRQLSFYLLGDTLHYAYHPSEIPNSYYALLTYGYDNFTNECTHIDLVVPNSSFNGILKRENLLPKANDSFFVIRPEDETTLVSLNEDLEQLVKLKTTKWDDYHEKKKYYTL